MAMQPEQQYSPEEEEALRLMLEEPASLGDLRSEGDPDWIANGARIQLQGLKNASHLNGLLGEVIGYDDEERRYRILLDQDGSVKKVAKKNLEILPPATTSAAAAVQPTSMPGATAVGDQQQLLLGPTTPTVSAPASYGNEPTMPSRIPSASLVPSRDTVQRAIQMVIRNTDDLKGRCELRQAGQPQAVEQDLSDLFLRLNVSVDTQSEVLKLYESAHGADAELSALSQGANESFEEVADLYQTVRSWKEYAMDEVNLTRYSIRKHGLVGTVKQEVAELGQDAVHVSREAVAVARPHVQTAAGAASRVPVLVRQGTSLGADAVRRRSQAASEAAGNAIHEQVIAPVKRTWSLLVMAFFLCYIVPLFALRAYSPMNSVVGNLGLVYSVMVVACPPRCAQSRAMRAFFLLMYPLLLVVMPIAVHYWLMHPPTLGGSDAPMWSPPQQLPPWRPQQLPSFLQGTVASSSQVPVSGCSGSSCEPGDGSASDGDSQEVPSKLMGSQDAQSHGQSDEPVATATSAVAEALRGIVPLGLMKKVPAGDAAFLAQVPALALNRPDMPRMPRRRKVPRSALRGPAREET